MIVETVKHNKINVTRKLKVKTITNLKKKTKITNIISWTLE